ncbi:hypothetical protein DMENIID0001_034080 [Sergentomyia squamirostris]
MKFNPPPSKVWNYWISIGNAQLLESRSTLLSHDSAVRRRDFPTPDGGDLFFTRLEYTPCGRIFVRRFHPVTCGMCWLEARLQSQRLSVVSKFSVNYRVVH